MLYSCTHMATVSVKGLIKCNRGNDEPFSFCSAPGSPVALPASPGSHATLIFSPQETSSPPTASPRPPSVRSSWALRSWQLCRTSQWQAAIG